MNPLIDYINDDSLYVISCNNCAKKNTSACNTCSRKRTEPKPKKECHQCSEKPKKCGCDDKKDNCTVKRSVCNSEFFRVLNYFSELVHDWEKDLAKYNLGISELESINYFTDLTETGELLNKVLFVFRRGHEIVTKEFLVTPKGDKGEKGDKGDVGPQGLKGDPGTSPVLRFVRVNYSDSPCDVNGSFELVNDNVYDLFLTLPKQRTFDECLEEIRKLINLFNINFEAQLASLTQKVNSLENFDFCNLGLKLKNGNELSLIYKGFTSNPVILDLPKLSEYTLKYFPNMESIWKDELALMKDGVKEGDVFCPEKFKPKDWWILPYPGVILIHNGELITKRIRVSAWLGGVDETVAQTNVEDRNFTMFLLTTASYEFNPETSLYDDSTWSSLNYAYNKSTGMLTLPENNTFSTVTDTINNLLVTRNIQYRYHSGDFVVAALWATDHLPRRILIPIIDVDNYTNTDTSTLLVDVNPTTISNDINYAVINYTKTWQFDLRGSNFYNSNGDLINCVIEVGPSTVIYKNYNGKKYFCGTYTTITCEDEAPSPEGTTLNINRFRLYQIAHPNQSSKKIRLYFKYLDDDNTLKDLTQSQYAAFYAYWKNHVGSYFNKAVRLKHKTNNLYIDLTLDDYSSASIPGLISYSYDTKDIINLESNFDSSNTYYAVSTGRRPAEPNDSALIKNFRLYVKDAPNTTDYQIYLNIAVLNSGVVHLTLPAENLQLYGTYTTVFNSNIMGAILDTISVSTEIVLDIDIPSGTTYSNGMFFYNGLYVGDSVLNGTPTISDDGKYAYVITELSVLILNLSNRAINVSFDDHTYTVNPKGNIIEELTPSEPVDPTNH